MKTVFLIVKEDVETGEIGMVCKGLPEIEGEPEVTRQGELLAHDLVEHVNGVKKIGSIEDELQALGAAWYTRGQWGDFNRDARYSRTPYETLAGDIEQLATKYIPMVTNSAFLSIADKRHKRDYVQENLDECIRIARQNVMKEIETETDADLAELMKARAAMFFGLAGKWMRKGYNKINRKFEQAVNANSLFWSIAEAINEQVGHLRKHDMPFAGTVYKLRYDPKGIETDKTSCELIY